MSGSRADDPAPSKDSTVAHPVRAGSLALRRGSRVASILQPLRRLLPCLAVLAGCQASTTRPSFGPVTGAASVILETAGPHATTLLAERLKAESIPVTRVEPRDGFLETPWFDTTGRPTGKRPLGPNVVRVRGWIDPEKPGFSRLTVETLYRDIADPSLPERELDREVAPDHPVSKRVRAVLDSLRKRYGEPDRSQ